MKIVAHNKRTKYPWNKEIMNMPNPWHDRRGKFSAYGDALKDGGSGSLQFAQNKKYLGVYDLSLPRNTRGKRVKPAKDNILGVAMGKQKPLCGRAARDAGKNIRCYEGLEKATIPGSDITLYGRPLFEAETDGSRLEWEVVEEGMWVALTDAGMELVVIDETGERDDNQPYGWYVLEDEEAEEPQIYGTAPSLQLAQAACALAVEDMVSRLAYIADPESLEYESLASILEPVIG